MADVAHKVSNATSDARHLSAVSPLGTTRGSTARVVHHDRDLHIAEEPFLGVFSVRQSRRQSDQPVIGDLLARLGLAAPEGPNTLAGTSDLACAWIEPRAWIITSTAAHAAAMKSAGGLWVTELSDRLCAFRLTGERAIEIIASGCDPVIAPPGSCTRARFASLGAVILQRWARHDWRILIDVSLAQTFAQWLQDAATNATPGNPR